MVQLKKIPTLKGLEYLKTYAILFTIFRAELKNINERWIDDGKFII